jgi:hypothetical protein
MADVPPRPPEDEPGAQVDVSWLLEEPRRPAPAAEPRPLAPGESYDLIDRGPAPPEAHDPALTAAPDPPAVVATKPGTTERGQPRSDPRPSVMVTQVWSRGAEWGPTLLRLGTVALAFALLVYTNVAAGLYAFAGVTVVVAAVVLLVLSYPILITFERPVRVTPEQAVNDYYAALSHGLPHYRRMWLLLSAVGRNPRLFAAFEDFQAAWKERLADFHEGPAPQWNPLRFRIRDFKSEKSAGQTEIDASYTVDVVDQRRPKKGPIATFPITTNLVRGPDRMWYLNQGTLPGLGPTETSSR